MVKSLLIFLFIFTSIATSFSAEIKYEIEQDKIVFNILFNRGYSNLDLLESKNSFLLSFETSEKLDFERQDFFDLPLESAYISVTDDRKKFVVTYTSDYIKPSITSADKQITISIPLTGAYMAGRLPIIGLDEAIGTNQVEPPPKVDPLPTTGSYFRMLFGLGIVLAIILIAYSLMRRYFKKQVFTDIPGTGRLLGKVDLDLRKSLYFYELGDIIYVIGVTDNNMTLIDKIVDDEEATKIRVGMTSKKDFAGYFSFFQKKNDLDDDISTSNAIMEEKLKSLREKR